MNSYRCPWCEIAWPLRDEFKSCPQCQEETKQHTNAAITDGMAHDLQAHAEFGWWLWDHNRA